MRRSLEGPIMAMLKAWIMKHTRMMSLPFTPRGKQEAMQFATRMPTDQRVWMKETITSLTS